ncbi:MAG: pyruvate formate lyase-activating protein [Synergistaceae bacterium]|nr:pyruvate formate lyase-activating protein [Synergistaceae bacterium]
MPQISVIPEVFGRVHSTESFGAVDGPGIRFVIFLKGCNMRCLYCHNPDTWAFDGADMQTPSALLDLAERYRKYWRKTGGITVSGGEPLLQPEFMAELFREAHNRKIHTALDTSAQPFTREEPFFGKFNAILEHTDLVLLDIKHIDPVKHKALTGHDNANILDAAEYLSEVHVPVWIRHVLVPEITDNDSDLLRLRKFLDGLGNVQKVEVLPYHSLGAEKWHRLGKKYQLEGINPPSDERIANAKSILGA